MKGEEVQYIVAGTNGKQYGPMNLETLKDLCLDDRVGPDTQVWDSTTGEWHEARQIEELSEYFPEEEEAAPAAVYEEEYADARRSSPLSIASLWCGIISVPTFCCSGWVLALLAVILGIIGKNEERRYGYYEGQAANVGMVCGFIALLLTSVLAAIFGPSFVDVLADVFREYGPK